LRYLSLFSGIESASTAWHSLGWTPAAFCEIDPFASAVLAERYPGVPNLGNVEHADFDAIGPIDLIVFGSPCQSYSVAGKRLGLDDPRGNLALIAGQIVYRKRPKWFVFENVPGLVTLDSGWDFGTVLAAFAGYPPGSVFEPPKTGWDTSGVVEQAENGYGLAWRVLDAQYVRVDTHPRAVPQRRKRVFVIGYLGDWRRAAAVLLERESLCGHPAPSRKAGERVAPTVEARANAGGSQGASR
jgi:DNA (cytosine-5)-methyltransferase 1